MTHGEWLEVCGLISSLWPHAPLPPHAAQEWFPLLADLHGPTVAAAVRSFAVAGDHRWPPSVGAIREHAEPPARDWTEALAELRRLASRHGSHRPKPEIEDGALDSVVESYGWRAVCAMDASDPAARAQFRDAYRSAQQRTRARRRFELARAASGAPAGQLGAGDAV